MQESKVTSIEDAIRLRGRRKLEHLVDDAIRPLLEFIEATPASDVVVADLGWRPTNQSFIPVCVDDWLSFFGGCSAKSLISAIRDAVVKAKADRFEQCELDDFIQRIVDGAQMDEAFARKVARKPRG